MSPLAIALADHQAGNLPAATAAYRAILSAAPSNPDAQHLLGLALLQQGAPGDALPPLRSAIALRPLEPLYLANYARAALAAQQPGEAEAALRRALTQTPDDPALHHDLGLALLRLHRPLEAEASLRRCLALQPAATDAHINLAAAQLAQHRPTAAAETLARVLARDPDCVPALCGLAASLVALARGPDAEANLRRAHRLAPADPAIATSLGNLLRQQGKLTDALPFLERAATPPGADSLNNLALAHSDAGRLDRAETLFTQALTLSPDHADADYNRATTRLLAGDFRAAWPGYERRWQRRGHAPPYKLTTPGWHGEATDRLLLLHAEQGLGDTIMMARFLPRISARNLVLAVPRTLLALLTPLAPHAIWHAIEDGIPPHDLHAAVMSLPAILDIAEPDLANPFPYLDLPERHITPWRQRLAALPGRKIGLAWAGNPAYPADAARSIPPALLAPLAETRNATFISLQPGATPPFPMPDWTAELTDMRQTAALVSALDLVISVDTAVAHLAGGLGRPTWLLNRFAPCWRWQLGRADSPWYPSLRQYRHPSPHDWPAVISAVATALA